MKLIELLTWRAMRVAPILAGASRTPDYEPALQTYPFHLLPLNFASPYNAYN